MRYMVLLLSLLAGTASSADAAPRLALSAYQVTPGTAVMIRAAGFTPGSIVISHLLKPDGTEYPTMTFEADARGEFSHTITIVPTLIGTYEIRMIDRDSRAATSTRFMMVAVGSDVAATSRAGEMPGSFAGVWQGSGAQKGASEASHVVLTLSGGGAGAVVGTVAYPSLLCGGEVWLLGVYGDSIQLAETITYGEERCAGQGILSVRPAADGLTFGWRSAQEPAPPIAAGTLVRRTE